MKEQYKEQLIMDGFKNIYDWTDEPGKEYESHSHQDKVALYVIEGSICFNLSGKHINLSKGDRLDVPPLTEHTAKVGEDGCKMVVGEMIKEDS